MFVFTFLKTQLELTFKNYFSIITKFSFHLRSETQVDTNCVSPFQGINLHVLKRHLF